LGVALRVIIINVERGITMKRFVRFIATAALALVFVGAALADTLELKDGRVLQGRYLGGTQAVLRFEVDGNVQTFRTNDIVAVTFTHASGYPAAAPAPPPSPDPVPQAQSVVAGGTVTIPAGQSILVRMIDAVDSSKNHVGDIFHASLETDLTVNGALVARKGTDFYGRLAEAKEAGHMAGSSELQLERLHATRQRAWQEHRGESWRRRGSGSDHWGHRRRR
jgi:hypothetical protein